MSLFTHIRDSIEGVGTAVAVGLPSTMIASGAAAATSLAGMLGGSGQGGGGGGGYGGQPQASGSSDSTDMGYQNSIAGLMNLIGQQQPQISATGMTSSSTGGLI